MMRTVLVLCLAVSSCASGLSSDDDAVPSDFSTNNNAVLDDLFSIHDGDEAVPELFSTRGRRQKRNAGGQDACMQIYTVPKRTVKCDPSDEVRDALAAIQDSLVDHAESIQGLGVRIDEIDPEKEKQLPEEVTARLLALDEVEETQAGHVEAIRRVDALLQHVSERMAQIEADDRAELATMIEQQSTLIKVALKQSNASLHDAYLERLTTSTQDLSSRLERLQAELGAELEATEDELEAAVAGAREEVLARVGEVSGRLDRAMEDLSARLREETANRVNYQNETDRNSEVVEELSHGLTTVQNNQAHSLAVQTDHTGQINDLRTQLQQLIAEKDTLTTETSQLTESVRVLQESFSQMRHDLSECRNTSGNLVQRVQVLTQQVERREHMLPRMLKITDCQDVLKYYYPASGIYTVQPDPTTRPFDVFCDMGTEGEGWTLVQRRQTGEVDFFRGWQPYKEGFGDLSTEFWMGLEPLYHLTHAKRYRLRVDLEDWDGHWFYATYDTFSISSEATEYTLNIGGYHGNAGDSLEYHNAMPFSTMDRNNDANEGICATWCRGAWWYRDCFESNLNGLYHKDNGGPYVTRTNWGNGMVWKHIKGTNFYSLKSSIMKILPVDLET